MICENTNVSNNRFTKLLEYTNKTLWSVGHTDGQKSRHSMCANNKEKKRENISVPSDLFFAVNSDANISAIFISIISCLKKKI